MMDLRAVRRYSQALFEISAKENTLDAIDDQLLAVRQLVENHPEISNLVSNSTIALAEKEDFIAKVMPASLSPLLINFLKVLIKKKRFKELPAIQEDFHRRFEQLRRIEEVIVVSAVPLSESNISKLESALEKRLKSSIRLTAKTDPEMIGGLILRFGGHEINAGFRSRLDDLRQLLTA